MTTRQNDTPAHRARRALADLIPRQRRVKPLAGARGRRLVQLRKLTQPLVTRPIVITSRDGLRMELTADPVDELVANDLLGRNRTLWFPEPPDRFSGDDALELRARVVLDLGAHHGFYAVTALARYSRATLIAVEPSAHGVACVRRNLGLNNLEHRARIVQGALASARGTGTLFHTDEGSWGNSLFREEGVAVLGEEKVSLLTLDEILSGASPDVVKCNAEGAEFSLIEQLGRTDIRPALMILMVHPEFGDLDKARSDVEALGYTATLAGIEKRPVLQAWRVAPTTS
jgi:FkbM family methyltransferase